VQQAGRLASSIVIGVIIARRNQSRTPESLCDSHSEESYSTRSVPNMVGCSEQAYAETPALLAVYFQERPVAISCESNCLPTAGEFGIIDRRSGGLGQ